MMTPTDCRQIAELSLAASRAMDLALAADDAGDPTEARRWHAEFTRLNQRRGSFIDENAERFRGERLRLDDIPEELRGDATSGVAAATKRVAS